VTLEQWIVLLTDTPIRESFRHGNLVREQELFLQINTESVHVWDGRTKEASKGAKIDIHFSHPTSQQLPTVVI
jgi:hypothetical protein